MGLTQRSVPLAAVLLSAILGCDRRTPTHARDTASAAAPARGAPESYPLLDSLPLVADDVAVATVDSTGLGGIAMCSPLREVNHVFSHAVAALTFCPEGGCD